MPGDKKTQNNLKALGFGEIEIKNKDHISIAELSKNMNKLMQNDKNQLDYKTIDAYLELTDKKLNPQKSARISVKAANKAGSENMNNNISQPRANVVSANKAKSQAQGH